MILLTPTVPEGAFDWQSLVGPAIAILALLFTIGSFWWLQARQGRLRSYPPNTLCFARKPKAKRLFAFRWSSTPPAQSRS